jgi:isopenicillin N synthase-like dioxygenase
VNVLTVDYNSKRAPELFSQSLKETGFAVLEYHPISTALIRRAYEQWQDFFAAENKTDYLYQKPSQQGYFPFRTENAKGSDISDLKEFYHFYLNGRIPDELRETTTELYQQLNQMASVLLQWIELHLPKSVTSKLSVPLKSMITDSPNTMLRILHYPPLKSEVEPGAVRAAAHEDINLITLLPAATTPGLEVLDVKGNWHAVTCDPGNIVVNVADMLQEATNQYYKSTTHRVVNPTDDSQNSSRYSMPLFLHARPEVQISEKYTALEYLHERLREIGIY